MIIALGFAHRVGGLQGILLNSATVVLNLVIQRHQCQWNYIKLCVCIKHNYFDCEENVSLFIHPKGLCLKSLINVVGQIKLLISSPLTLILIIALFLIELYLQLCWLILILLDHVGLLTLVRACALLFDHFVLKRALSLESVLTFDLLGHVEDSVRRVPTKVDLQLVFGSADFQFVLWALCELREDRGCWATGLARTLSHVWVNCTDNLRVSKVIEEAVITGQAHFSHDALIVLLILLNLLWHKHGVLELVVNGLEALLLSPLNDHSDEVWLVSLFDRRADFEAL